MQIAFTIWSAYVAVGPTAGMSCSNRAQACRPTRESKRDA